MDRRGMNQVTGAQSGGMEKVGALTANIQEPVSQLLTDIDSNCIMQCWDWKKYWCANTLLLWFMNVHLIAPTINISAEKWDALNISTTLASYGILIISFI